MEILSHRTFRVEFGASDMRNPNLRWFASGRHPRWWWRWVDVQSELPRAGLEKSVRWLRAGRSGLRWLSAGVVPGVVPGRWCQVDKGQGEVCRRRFSALPSFWERTTSLSRSLAVVKPSA